jgi:hypothetical protein
MAIVTGAITGITKVTGIAGRAARTTSVCPDRVPGGHGWDGGSTPFQAGQVVTSGNVSAIATLCMNYP